MRQKMHYVSLVFFVQSDGRFLACFSVKNLQSWWFWPRFSVTQNHTFQKFCTRKKRRAFEFSLFWETKKHVFLAIVEDFAQPRFWVTDFFEWDFSDTLRRKSKNQHDFAAFFCHSAFLRLLTETFEWNNFRAEKTCAKNRVGDEKSSV